MAQEPTTVENQPQAEQLQTSSQSISTDEMAELEISNGRTLYAKVYELAENFAATRLGQFVTERADGALQTVEDTAKWSLPQDKSEPQLARPLSWLPFLTLIVILRLVRMWCSVGALLIGDGPVTAQNLVYFMQTRRRKLRSIRLNGLKAIQERETEVHAKTGFVGLMQRLLSNAICRPDQELGRIFVHRGKEQLCNNKEVDSPKGSSSPEKSDLNLTCAELLTKYANENSEDDSDFIPNPDEETNDDESSTSVDCSASSNNSADELEQDQSNSTTITTATSDKDKEESKSSQSQKKHDISVELKENANGHKHRMPIPFIAGIKLEPMSDNESSSSSEQQVQTPKENVPNGPSNGDRQEEAQTDVAPKKASKLILPNGGNQLQQRSTPGHESAALTKPKLQPALGTTATAVPTNTDELSSTSSFSFPCSTSNALNPDNYSFSSSLSNLASSSSSASSLAFDLVTNEEFFVNDNLSEPRTPTPTLYSSNFENSESSNLISASSSEDIFYSPIGSPPDFNAVFQPVSILKNPIVTQPRASEAHSTPKTIEAEEAAAGSAESQPDSSVNQKKNIHYQRNTSQNRNRRNRR